MLGFFLASLTRLTLGLLGGSSILTVPILVYTIGMETKAVVALSLTIVGTITLFGTIGHLLRLYFTFKLCRNNIILFSQIYAIPNRWNNYRSLISKADSS